MFPLHQIWPRPCKNQPYFEEKVKGTNTQSFKQAVYDVLFEVCKRAELGLECGCREWILQNDRTFNGVRESEEVKRTQDVDNVFEHHKDVTGSKGLFDKRRTLDFIRIVARSPCDNSLTSTLEASLSQGHALGVRNGLFSQRCKATLPVDGCIVYRSRKLIKKQNTREGEIANLNRNQSPTQCLPWKVGHASVKEAENEGNVVESKRCGNAGNATCNFSVKECERSKIRCIVEGPRHDNGDPLQRKGLRTAMEPDLTSNHMSAPIKEGYQFWRAKIAVKEPAFPPCHREPASNLMRILEGLQTLATDPLYDHHITTLLARDVAALFKFRMLTFEKSPGWVAVCRGLMEVGMPHAHNTSTLLQHDIGKALQDYRWRAIQKLKIPGSTREQPPDLHQVPDSAWQEHPDVHKVHDSACDSDSKKEVLEDNVDKQCSARQNQPVRSPKIHVSAFEQPPKDSLKDSVDKQHSGQNSAVQPCPEAVGSKCSCDGGKSVKPVGNPCRQVPSRCEKLDVHELLLRAQRQRCEIRK